MFRGHHSLFQSLFMDICKTETCRNCEFHVENASCEKYASKKEVCSYIWESQTVACGKYVLDGNF